MPSSKKCPECKLCLDIIHILPRRFYHCYLCDRFFDVLDNKITQVDVDVEMKKHLDILVKQEEEKLNERFSQAG